MNKIVIYKLQNDLNEVALLGVKSRNIQFMQDVFKISIFLRNSKVSISEEDIEQKNVIVGLFETIEFLLSKTKLSDSDLLSIIKNYSLENTDKIIELFINKKVIYTTVTGKSIYPRTLNQLSYINAMENNDIVFATGPAGTGKTYLAVLYAISVLKKNQVKKIVLVRPVVEAGEKLGFLPGDLKEKVDPYLIPLYDGLNEALGTETVEKLIDKGIIEVSPLAYMRGRTLENAIIILDEAQNTTKMQMKMFLTRLGFNSKMIITGDITQVDLPYPEYSGLIEAIRLLNMIKGIEFIEFQKFDVMRHPLLYKIIQRYEGN
ncbi:MAG TPA: PhoH family protein [Acholeplasmataceae bacterium]|nr:PhoH family protein [Acholeplasmataceae bacterium]